jgi:hypothetical protein
MRTLIALPPSATERSVKEHRISLTIFVTCSALSIAIMMLALFWPS